MAFKSSTEDVELPLVVNPDAFTYFLGGPLSFILGLTMMAIIARGHWDHKS